MADPEIHELTTEAEWVEAFPVMVQLRPHLDEESFLAALRRMTDDGYHLFARSVDGEIVSVAGVRTAFNMYDGRHVWVDELVTDEAHRSQGHGLALLSFVRDWAVDNGCERLALSSGVQRTDAHRFYEERAGMDRASYVYKESLD